jgi:hypothetical protein
LPTGVRAGGAGEVLPAARVRGPISFQPSVTVRLRGFHGNLLDYLMKKRIAKALKRVAYRADGAITQSAVVHWRRELPKARDESWFLMTDRPGTASEMCRLHGRRMTIEQLFRDERCKRIGRAPRDTQITTPERFDRLLLILAVAFLLLCGASGRSPERRSARPNGARRRGRRSAAYTRSG